MNERSKLARRIRTAREGAKISQGAAAYRAGMKRERLVRIESGIEAPTAEDVRTLAAMYGANAEIWLTYLKVVKNDND